MLNKYTEILIIVEKNNLMIKIYNPMYTDN